jgi:hypothetical protein
MRQLAAALVLACVLSGAAQAGEIPTSDRTKPHPSRWIGEIPSGDQTPPQLCSTGEIPSASVTEPESSDIMLTILLSIFSIVR